MTIDPNMLQDDVSREALLRKLEALMARIQDEQLPHFAAAIEQVANCYMADNIHATLLVMNERDDSQSVIAINADDQQVAEMVDLVAQAFQLHGDAEKSGHMN